MKYIGLFIIFFIGQLLVFYQLYGPLKYQWLNNNKWFLYLMSIPIAYLFINAIRITSTELDSNWSARFMMQVAGITSFMLANYLTFGEGFSLKNLISFILAIGILSVQVLLK